MHHAVNGGTVDMVEVLCQYMSLEQFFIEDEMGNKPLDIATNYGFHEIAEILSSYVIVQ